jgi:16S rRNA (cytosine967-C5)-methyltransferase
VTEPPARRHGTRRPRRGRPRPDLPRRVAFDLLRAVDERDAYANLALPALLRDHGLAGRDAAFTTELAYGTLRGRGTYDAVLAACVDRPLDRVDAPVLDVLRLGAHQLLAMRVPGHAAVAATVELARAVVGESRGSFVNAVLRRVGGRSLDDWLGEVAPPLDADPLGHLAVRHSHPRWVVSALRDALGGDLAATAELLAADNRAPAVTLVARPGRAGLPELLAAGARPGAWSPYAAVLEGGDPAGVPAVREGRAGVQDEGSQLVALALAAAPLTGRDERWLDLCAGPGGKASLLAAVAAGRGARMLAAEVAPHRARLVRQAAGQGADVVVADGRTPPWVPGTFDRVLLDAPCTGLGALRRRPEARWRRAPGDVPALTRLQRDLLGSALRSVRPGGLVAYVTCSPHLAETRAVVSDALRAHAGVTREDARPLLPGVPDLGDGPDVQLWPHRHGTDAMFLSLLRRNPD